MQVKEKSIQGHTYKVCQLPAMRAWKILAMTQASGGNPLQVEDFKFYISELLAGATVDNQNLQPLLDLHFTGKVNALLEVIAFALEVNFSDFTNIAGDKVADQQTATPANA
jgi:hypothetical protein